MGIRHEVAGRSCLGDRFPHDPEVTRAGFDRRDLRRVEPSGRRVDGARTPLNSVAIPPWRSTSRSSMESAPATIPATIDITFAAGWAPADPEPSAGP